MKTTWISLFAFNKFNFGNRPIHQFVLIEIKPLFSIIFFWFHKSDNIQDRYHTHAFNAISIKLFGEYDEHVLLDESTGESIVNNRTQVIKYFPRDSYHAIGKSKRGCLTILFSGPWHKHWKEWIDGKVARYSWSRVKL
jgi:hypothetical protein